MRGRQIIGSRRIVLMAVVDGDVIVDHAVNLPDFDLAGYWRELFPPEMIAPALRDGEKPSWFTVHPLTNAQIIAAPPKENALQRAAWIVRCGLTAIENFTVLDADGNEHPAPQPTRKESPRLGLMCSEEWLLDQSELSMRDIAGLASMIEHISTAIHPFSRRSAGRSGGSAAVANPTAPTDASPILPTAPNADRTSE